MAQVIEIEDWSQWPKGVAMRLYATAQAEEAIRLYRLRYGLDPRLVYRYRNGAYTVCLVPAPETEE